jgi:DNA-binding beta-propeller fold protein YncE
MIDPRQPAGLVTTVVSNLPDAPQGIAFDGAKVWTANSFGSTLSIITPGAAIPWTVTNVNIALGSSTPFGLLFDGTFIWATDVSANTVVKLDTTGAILQTISGVAAPYHPVFDGTNVWVPNYNNPGALTVLRPASGAVLQVLTGNGLSFPYQAAFDGERILVTNQVPSTVSLWKAADMTPLGSVSISSIPRGAASDGLNFWVTFGAGSLARF